MTKRNELFDKVSVFNAFFKKNPENEFYKDEVETKWKKIFTKNIICLFTS